MSECSVEKGSKCQWKVIGVGRRRTCTELGDRAVLSRCRRVVRSHTRRIFRFSHACVSTVNNGYLIQGSLAMIVEGGYVGHVGDLPLEAVA
jgi:hypothetical protein